MSSGLNGAGAAGSSRGRVRASSSGAGGPGPGTTPGQWLLLGAAVLVWPLVGLLLVAGGVSSLVTGGGWVWPTGHVIDTVTGIVTHPSTPATAYPPALAGHVPGPTGFWVAFGVLAGTTLMCAVIVAVAVMASRPVAGFATRRQVQAVLGAQALRAGGDELRPAGLTSTTSTTASTPSTAPTTSTTAVHQQSSSEGQR